MINVSRLRLVSLLIFILPILSINICLVLSQIFEFREYPSKGNYFGDFKVYNAGDALRDKQSTEWAIPYLDGSASISRIGRVFPNSLIFKPALIFTGLLIIYYWTLIRKIFSKLEVKNKVLNKIFIFGVLTGVCLVIHSIFLGIKIDNDLYKLIIRLNLFFTLVFGLTSKIFFISMLKKINSIHIMKLNKKIISVKLLIVIFLTIIALVVIPILPFVESQEFKYILEWNYYIVIFTFYLITFFLIKDINL